MSELVKTLRNYADSDYLPMHMPGHKRRLGAGEMGDPFFIDITEIEGTDNLHHAEGVLKYVQEQVKDFGKNAVMIENCGMPDEKIYASGEEIPESAGYYSLIIIKEEGKE